MKILILTNKFGGLYNFRREVVQALLEKGHTVSISAPLDYKTHFFEEMGCEIIETNFERKGTNPIKDLGLMLRYRKLLRLVNPDVVLTYTIKPNLYGGMACQLCGVPQIANVTGLGSAVENPGFLQNLTILLYRIGLRKTKVTFFQNRANMEFSDRHKMVRGRTELIPGSGVNLQFHAAQPYPSESDPVRFIFISRLIREKGIDEYLGAAELIKKTHPEVEFHILGRSENSYESRVKKMQEEGLVVYHGLVTDVRPYIAKSHCTIHPSFYPEGMSNVLLESCAAGRPVITTNRPGCGEIVEEGKTGFLVKAKDVSDLVATIERFMTLSYSQKEQMGRDARSKVEKEFDRQIIVDRYCKEIDNIL